MPRKNKGGLSPSLQASQNILDEAKKVSAELSAENSDVERDPVTNEPIVRTERRARPAGMKVISSGAAFKKWQKGDVFTGHFIDEFKAPKDIPGGAKKGEVIGYNFLNDQTGQIEILGNNHSVKEAIEKDGMKTTTLWWIEFIEEIKVKGKPFKQFFIAQQNAE